ncbi:MAG: carbonic anhydrase family protein [Oxalobacteraceae bacterium]
MRNLIVLTFCVFMLGDAFASATLDAAAGKPATRRAAPIDTQYMREADVLSDLIAARLAALRERNAAKLLQNKKTSVVTKPKAKTTSTTAKPDPSFIARHAAVPWSYAGEGAPMHWGKLNADWTQCDLGTRQSPIDVRDGIRVELEPIVFNYQPARFNVLDNGHTVQVNLGSGNHITVMNKTYELVQFHFHRPSEERINGRASDMVAHLVHKDADGKLAVVAVLLDGGNPNDLVQTIWNNLPLEKNDPVIPTSLIDMNQLLPAGREYYTYMGSLTTPPCSEGVLWMVMKQPMQLSADQIAIFSRLYPMNARPIQAGSGRLIKESN